MKAAVLKGKGDIEVSEVPCPEISEDTMLIRVEACGVCGSDLRICYKSDKRVKYPIIVGHEIAGVVEKVGGNVTGFNVGDRVSAAPGHGCLECVYCKKGQENICLNPYPSIGYAYNGGYAQYFVPPAHIIKAGFVNRILDSMSFAEASISEPLACCLNAHRNLGVEKGNTVLVIGAGPIGCLHLTLARLNGASKVFLADIDSERLELAEKFSPDKMIDPLNENIKEVILGETDSVGVDIVLVCAPSKQAQMDGLKVLAPKGKINFFGGLAKDDCKIEVDANVIHYKELIVTGTSSSTAEDNKEALRLLAEKKINASDFITHEFSLDKVEDALLAVKNKRTLKAIIRPWK